VVQNGFNNAPPTQAEKIVYCVTSVQKLLDMNSDFIFKI